MKSLKIDYEGFRAQLLVKIACQRCPGPCRTRFWRVPRVSGACLGRLLGALKRFLAALGRLLGVSWAALRRVSGAPLPLLSASGLPNAFRRQARPRFCIDFYSILASFCQAPLAEMPTKAETKALPLSYFFEDSKALSLRLASNAGFSKLPTKAVPLGICFKDMKALPLCARFQRRPRRLCL